MPMEPPGGISERILAQDAQRAQLPHPAGTRSTAPTCPSCDPSTAARPWPARRHFVRQRLRRRLRPPSHPRRGFHPRNLLSLAALSAIRFHPACQALHDRPRANSRQHKLALVAGMQRLVMLVAALLRDDRMQEPEAPGKKPLA